MNSRERVRAVLNHDVPDRIPCGLGGCETSGLHLLGYDKLQNILGIKKTPPRLDTFMMNAVFEMDAIRAMEGDIILLSSPRMCRSRLWGSNHETEWKEQVLWNKTFRVSVKEKFTAFDDGSMVWDTAGGSRCPSGGLFFDSVTSEDHLTDYEVPSPDKFNPPHDFSEAFLRDLEKTAKELYEETDLSICCGETITDLQIQPCGFVGTMMLMKTEPDIMHEFLEKSVDAALAQLRQLNQAIGKYVDILSIAHDFGDNRGVIIGAPLWNEIYRPHYKKLFAGWKRITDMKINLHTCGSVLSILPDLAEFGLDIYNPVQVSAEAMEPQRLKDKLGNKLVFFGGAYDAQHNPQDADYDEVFEKVRSNILALKPGGGYIFAGVHNLPGDMPQHHLQAMLDAWRDTRDYT